MRRVVIQKVDLDTCLTALLLGVSEADEICVVADRAPTEWLDNPRVICIECGGSGQVDRNNYDHHDTPAPLPPACVQAQGRVGPLEPHLRSLVEYVAAVDTGDPQLRSRLRPPTLSQLFSGLLLTHSEPRVQLLEGIRLLREVAELGLPPEGPLPARPEWEVYLRAKVQAGSALAQALQAARMFQTAQGRTAGYLQADVPGAVGALYALGCQVAVACSSRPFRKYTIGAQGVRLDRLREALAALEPGWGGPAHGTILGSPRGRDSRLDPATVLDLVRRLL